MEDAREKFCERLNGLRKPTSDGKYFFIPEQVHDLVRDMAALVGQLTTAYFPDHHASKAVQDIVRNCPRLFCILASMNRLDLLPVFFTHGFTLDSQLPEANFHRIAPDLDAAFWVTWRWEFFPWELRKEEWHQVLPDATILPILTSEKIGEGAGGEIYVIGIPTEQQDLYPDDDDKPKVRIVRKRIKRYNQTATQQTEVSLPEDDETACLELYRTLRHPNIIPLLGSFTLGATNNLLFPYYSMDLAKFLKTERFGEFRDDTTMTRAISSLASALQTVHEMNLRSRMRPLYQTNYGFHHDIRPANILVSVVDSTFILADFGLAYPLVRRPPENEPPVISWVENVGYYIAPECMDEMMMPRLVGRSYDIWAFGCLLADLATYMALGPTGVQQFSEERILDNYYVISWTNRYFFRGDPTTKQVALKDGVTSWLDHLYHSSRNHGPTISSLVSCSRGMLVCDPDYRPSMAASAVRLSFVHAKCLFSRAVEMIEGTLAKFSQPNSRFEVSQNTTVEVKIQLSKLRAFGDILGLTDPEDNDCRHFTEPSFATSVEQGLGRIFDELQADHRSMGTWVRVWTTKTASDDRVATRPASKQLLPRKLLDQPIRDDIRKLCESVSDPRYDDLVAKHIVSYMRTDNSTFKAVEKYAAEESSSPDGLYAEMGIHAKLRRLNEALQSRKEQQPKQDDSLVLDWALTEITSNLGRYHNLGKYSGQKVLIEWMFLHRVPEGEPEDARIQKLFDLAELLRCDKPKGLRTLTCLGFLTPNKGKGIQGYGFVFLPPSFAPEDGGVGANLVQSPGEKLVGGQDRKEVGQLRTLHHLLTSGYGKLSEWFITLDDRFEVAKSLAVTVGKLHRHDWLHKNIRSENIVFLVEDDDEYEKSPSNNSKKHAKKGKGKIIKGPYLIGFHHGRQDGGDGGGAVFYSDVPSAEVDENALLYAHPKYKYDVNRFEKRFDRYSLGLVLLEVGFWKSLQKLKEEDAKIFGRGDGAGSSSRRTKESDRDDRDISNGEGRKGRDNGSTDMEQFHARLARKYAPKLAEGMGTGYMHAVLACLDGGGQASQDNTVPDRNADRNSNIDDVSVFYRDVVQRLEACRVRG